MVDGVAVRVVDEPHTVHRGWSPFDEFELLLGAYVESIEAQDAEYHYLVIGPEEPIWLVGRASRCGSRCHDPRSAVARERLGSA